MTVNNGFARWFCRWFACLGFATIFLPSFAQNGGLYKSLDQKNPIELLGSQIVYEGDTLKLGPNAFFVDGQLPDSIVAKWPWVFNSIRKALSAVKPGTADQPSTLHIAPWVYWIDNPDDTAIRVGKNGAPPFGMEINCPWLKFHGLTKDAANVVLACNRGQTLGARGNFTMFKIDGDGIVTENITFGNYCNIDLEFPLNAALNKKRRSSAIVQAQLIIASGDKIVARNTRFLSRLNLCPFVGAKRILFDHCYFECTDDALCGTGVYLSSRFKIFSSKPFYHTTGTGAVFLNCDIESVGDGPQYFTKANGQVVVVDSRFVTGANTTLSWRDVVPVQTRNYQFGAMQNERPVIISKGRINSTVIMHCLPLLNAYRFVQNGKVLYNVFNLLSGDDGWDPMMMKPEVEKQELITGKLHHLPVQLKVLPDIATIETGKDTLTLSATALRFGNYPSTLSKVEWRILGGNEKAVKLIPDRDGAYCKVVPLNDRDTALNLIVEAFTSYGLKAAAAVKVSPSILPPPAFKRKPAIIITENGQAELQYELATKYTDASVISWFRCRSPKDKQPIEVAVSRGAPLKAYKLTAADVGYYLMAIIRPAHIRSALGQQIRWVTSLPVVAKRVSGNRMHLAPDLKQMSTANQPKLIPGCWVLGHFPPVDPEGRYPQDTTRDAWFYGEGLDGAQGMHGLLQGRSAVVRYVPLAQQKGNMQVQLQVAPYKTAGQGFAVANLYMDILIQFDHYKNTGYALRLMRTTRHHDAVEACFVKYESGKVLPISDTVVTTAFRSLCNIQLQYVSGQLLAEMTTSAPPHARNKESGVAAVLRLNNAVSQLTGCGMGIVFNGGSPVLFKAIVVEWSK